MSSHISKMSVDEENHESETQRTYFERDFFAKDPELVTGTDNTETNENHDTPTTVNTSPSNASMIMASAANTSMIVGSAPNPAMIHGSAPNPTMLATPSNRFNPYDNLTVPNERPSRSPSPFNLGESMIVKKLLEGQAHPPFLLGIDRSALFTASLCSERINNGTPSPLNNCSSSCFPRNHRLTLCSMILLMVSAYANMSMLAPFFPEESKKKHLSSILDGVVFSIYALFIMIMSPLVGMLIPKINCCAIYLIGIALVGSSNIAFGMITYIEEVYTFFFVSVILRFIGAVGAACYLTIMFAIVPKVFPNHISIVTGMLEIAVGVGMCMGPALGTGFYSIGGFQLPFFVVGGFMLFCIPFCWKTFPSDINQSSEDTQGVNGVFNIMFNPGVFLSICILACTSFCQALLFPTLQPHLRELGVSIEHVGWIFLLLSVGYIIATLLVAFANNHYKCPEAFMLAGLTIMAIALFFLGHSPILPFISTTDLIIQDLIAISLMGISMGMCIVPTFAAMLQYSSENEEPLNLATFAICGGLFTSFYSFGEMVGPLYAVLLCEYFSFGTVTTITCLLPLTLMLLLVFFMILQCNK